MMATNDALNADSSPKGIKTGVKRLNKKPLFFIGIIFLIVILLLAYAISQRGKTSTQAQDEQKEILSANTQQAADLLIGQYDTPPEIPKELRQEPIPEVDFLEQFSEPKPEPKVVLPPIVSDAELARLERLEKIRARREQLLLSALTSKTASAQVPDQSETKAREKIGSAEQMQQTQLELLKAARPAPVTDITNIENLLMQIAKNTGTIPASQTANRATPAPASQTANRATPAPASQTANRATPAPASQTANRATSAPANQATNRATSAPANQATNRATPATASQTKSDYTRKLEELKTMAPAGTFGKVNRAYSYSQEGLRDQLTKYDLRVGTVIPAVMISGINSDISGEVIAQVTQNVFDSTHGEAIVVPQGTRAIGVFSNDVNFGQERIGVIWNRLQFPNGQTLALGGIGGSDKAGYSGFKDKVNNHYLKTFGGATLLSLISGLAQSSQSDNGATVGTGETISNALGQQYAEVGTELVKRNLDTSPTIEIRAGYLFSIILNKDLVLDEYNRT